MEKNLQAFRRAGVRPIDTKALVSEMVAEKNDRGAVLIGGALVELALRRLVQSRFALPPTETESLFENDAPLSAFHNLARIGYAMGLFDSQIKQDLDRVREIRNLFAHSLHPISFDTPEIAAACSLFQVIPPRIANMRDIMDVPNPSKKLFLGTVLGMVVRFTDARKATKSAANGVHQQQ